MTCCEICDHADQDHTLDDDGAFEMFSGPCEIESCACPAFVRDPTPVEPWEVTR